MIKRKVNKFEKMTGRRNKEGFIKITHQMFDNINYIKLSSSAKTVLLLFIRRYNGMNNGEIGVGIAEGAKLCNLSKNTFSKASHELIDKGFIKVKTKGMFTYKLATTYILTFLNYNNNPPTNEWKEYKNAR